MKLFSFLNKKPLNAKIETLDSKQTAALVGGLDGVITDSGTDPALDPTIDPTSGTDDYRRPGKTKFKNITI